ncbi:MAG: chemotaxis-specific protein-glutamate methyltransferase CheB [Deltaproteobacteria bacterium]|nr:chemotaxis-specific protein-glutamate methyltransferase CheB [Deltaproteobacteria bacterium]
MAEPGVIRVLVIDDSAYNRQTLTAMLESDPGIRVVGRAADGDEGLQQALTLAPDVITLDLEMPRVGGFAFLRLLMRRRPTAVVVVSSYASRDNVFKALELGALDFIAKPTALPSAELRTIERDLTRKVRACTQLRAGALAERAHASSRPISQAVEVVGEPGPALPQVVPAGPLRICAIGASTGGPPALQRIMHDLDAIAPLAVLITQHMPPRFTAAFAERLDRHSRFDVCEAKGTEPLRPGLALVAPGSGSLCLERTADGYVARVAPGTGEDRFVPSVDRMLTSAAAAAGPDLCAVVLTGMGGDGGRGVRAVHDRGGRVFAEAPETAVIFGMPQEAIATGVVDEIVPVGAMAEAIARFAGKA